MTNVLGLELRGLELNKVQHQLSSFPCAPPELLPERLALGVGMCSQLLVG